MILSIPFPTFQKFLGASEKEIQSAVTRLQFAFAILRKVCRFTLSFFFCLWLAVFVCWWLRELLGLEETKDNGCSFESEGCEEILPLELDYARH